MTIPPIIAQAALQGIEYAKIGVIGMLIVAIGALWKKQNDADKVREVERIEANKKRDERIAILETNQEAHSREYKVLAETVTTVLAQTRDVMQQVLEKISP